MRIVAGYTSKPVSALPVTPAELHVQVVAHEGYSWSRITIRKHVQDCECVVQRSSRSKIQRAFTWLGNSRVARLMTEHADVVCEACRQPRRIYDGGVYALKQQSLLTLLRVKLPRSVTIFAADSQLSKWRILIQADSRRQRSR